MNQTIKKAIFPVAGLGTRFLPATKASPKEMLTVVDKPIIQYAVEEAIQAGIEQIIFVTGRNKYAIENHFDTAYELEQELFAKEKHDLLECIRSIKPDYIDIVYIRQARALGLGHAILCAQSLLENEAFAVILADDLIFNKEDPRRGVLRQMCDLYQKHQTNMLAIEEVPISQTQSYGVIAGHSIEPDLLSIHNIVEKPKPENAPSNLAVVGRYILEPEIFQYLRAKEIGAGGEIQLTDAIAKLLTSQQVLAYRYQGQRYDCGHKLGYLKANVEMALQHPELRDDFLEFLQSIKL
jgi:UTP--glucose-1-phosphate uridylyltransferase